MAVESKPLFHPEVIRQHVRAFRMPDRVEGIQPKLAHWAELIASGSKHVRETDPNLTLDGLRILHDRNA